MLFYLFSALVFWLLAIRLRHNDTFFTIFAVVPILIIILLIVGVVDRMWAKPSGFTVVTTKKTKVLLVITMFVAILGSVVYSYFYGYVMVRRVVQEIGIQGESVSQTFQLFDSITDTGPPRRFEEMYLLSEPPDEALRKIEGWIENRSGSRWQGTSWIDCTPFGRVTPGIIIGIEDNYLTVLIWYEDAALCLL